jgi:hypothetical protein
VVDPVLALSRLLRGLPSSFTNVSLCLDVLEKGKRGRITFRVLNLLTLQKLVDRPCGGYVDDAGV